MKFAIRYYTRSGNTKKLALALAEALNVDALDIAVPLNEPVDILFLGNSVYAFSADENVERFINDNAKNIKCIVNFSTAALVKSTYKSVKKIAENNNITMHEDEFYCKGKFGIIHKNRPNEEDLNNIKEFGKKIVNNLEEKK